MEQFYSQFSLIDEYGFKRNDKVDPEWFENYSTRYIKILSKRRIKWDHLSLKSDFGIINSQLKRFIRKGVPALHRPEIWMKVSGANKMRAVSPGLYKSLLNRAHENEVDDLILIDLPRTYPENIYFEAKKQKLFNVLLAYALHNQKVGYCQGLNYVAGLLIIVTDDEEKAFWLLKVIIEFICPEYHTNDMKNLIRDLAVLKKLINQRFPDIDKKLEYMGLPYAVVSSKWFICLFAEVLPIETVLRIWDCIFSEGYKILFRVALALITTNKKNILECDEIATAVELFRNRIPVDEFVTDCHSFMETIFKIKLKRSELESLRRESVGTSCV